MYIIKKSKFREATLPSIFLVTLMITSSYSINYIEAFVYSEPHPANAMWLEPSSVITASIGDKFNVTVFINVTLQSFAWQVKLYFNSTFLKATKIGYTNGNKSDFFSEYSPIPIIPIINNEEGYVIHGESLLGNDEKSPGYGSLMWIELNLTQIPSQNSSIIYFSTPYGIDTFILTPYINLIPIESFDRAEISVGLTKTPSSPPFPDINTLILIAIVLVVIITGFVIIRKRKSKKHEKSTN
ncbi:MAG: hypothetical protein ACFFBQ_20065 [Promethearchaeota archaeon]